MEFPYGMEMMFKDKIPHLPHGNDGLIFTCKGTPYVPGTDQHILKWKPPHENTIDFRLLLGDFPMSEQGEWPDWDAKPELELHINHGGGQNAGYKFFATLYLTDTEWESCKRLNQQLDGRIIECYRDPVQKSWRPKLEPDGSPRFRDDKTDSNHISVVDSVLESIEDAVTEQDLISAAAGIKVAFKARAHQAELKAKEEAKRAMAAQAEKKRAQEEMMKQQRRASETAEEDLEPRYED